MNQKSEGVEYCLNHEDFLFFFFFFQKLNSLENVKQV